MPQPPAVSHDILHAALAGLEAAGYRCATNGGPVASGYVHVDGVQSERILALSRLYTNLEAEDVRTRKSATNARRVRVSKWGRP